MTRVENHSRILVGDVRARLREVPDESVQTVVSSPPYWGLRDYGLDPQVWGGDSACVHAWSEEGKLHRGGANGGGAATVGRDQSARDAVKEFRTGSFCMACGAWRGDLGLEPSPELYVEHVVEVFREVRRVLRYDGTVWLNLGDCYATGSSKSDDAARHRDERRRDHTGLGRPAHVPLMPGYRGNRPPSGKHAVKLDVANAAEAIPMVQPNRMPLEGLKPKDLVGVPWMVAFALRADGWQLRSDIVWHKPNPMPESVEDRPTKAHEYLFLLSKSGRYFYDKTAILEPVTGNAHPRGEGLGPKTVQRDLGIRSNESFNTAVTDLVADRNKRSVWTVPTTPFEGAHFAVMPEELVEPCVRAGTSEKGACSRCRAPWLRITKKVPAEGRASGNKQRKFRGDWGGAPHNVSQSHQGFGFPHDAVATITLGWRPSCTCPERRLPPVPCRVLDPFAGAGTVGVVALRLGREFYGIELKQSYAEMARDRIHDDAPLFNHSELDVPVVSDATG